MLEFLHSKISEGEKQLFKKLHRFLFTISFVQLPMLILNSDIQGKVGTGYILKSSKTGIMSNFQMLSNSADFTKMSTNKNGKFLENLK